MKKATSITINNNRTISHGLRIMAMVFSLTIISIGAFAQGDPGLPGGGTDADAPIDGGLCLLIAAGIGYGARKLNTIQRNRPAAQ